MPNILSGVQDLSIQGTGTITDYETSASERFGSELAGAFDTNPLAQGARMARYAVEANAPFFGLESNMVSPEVAKEELKSRGLEGHITVPEGGISRVEFDSIQYLKQRELSRQAKSAMNQSTFAHILGFAGGLVGSAADPINIASAFVPIVQEARIASMLGKAGASTLGRAAVRAQVGATEGVVGALMIEPFTYAMSQYEQMDYTPADSFMNVVFGGLLGGGLHMAGGAVYDWRATRALNSLQRGMDSMNMRDMAPDVQDEVQLDILRRFTEAEENGTPLPDADEIIAQRMTPDQRSAVREADGMPGEVPTPTRADGQPSQPRGLNELIPEAKADRTSETFNRQFLDKEQGDVSGFADVRPPREDIFEVAQANFAGRTQHTAKTVPIDQLSGGVSADPAEAKRVSNLVDLMSAPNGYLERLIVDTDGNVIEGQHRLEALRKMGVKEVPVIEIRELREGLPVDRMMDAMQEVRGLHRDQARQIIDQIAEAIADVGSVAEVRAQYAPPRGFERAWEAALNAAEAADDLKAQSAPAKDALGKFTEAFWRWFGGSKVVDEDGKPLVVYHGTPNGEFFEFEKGRPGTTTFIGIPVKTQRHGFFFAEDKAFSQSFAEQGDSRTGAVMSVYLSIKNPLRMPEIGVLQTDIEKLVAQGVDRKWLEEHAGNIRETWEAFDDEQGAWFVERIKQAGYDGVYFTELNEATDQPADVWVAFEPTQIKSATGNRGTYDPELADIRAQSDIVDDAAGPNSGLTPYTQSLGGQTDVNQPQSPDVLGTQETGLRLLTGVRRSPGILPPSPAWSDTAPLAYLPTTIKVPGVGTVEAGAFPLARRAARDYVESTGRAYDPITTYRKVDPARAGRIAEAFEQMRHEPDNPEVKAAYEAMVKETLAQWEAVKRTGLVVEFIDISKGDPYAASPRLATEDVRNNNHLWVFATDDGFGTDGITAKDESDNPLFQIVPGETISGKQVRANDIFRIVHDYFGHIKDGVGFRADGEENAWRSHSRMYSPQAARAMTTETRGQNSWLNYGPYGEKNRTALTQDTIFAEQKIGLLPDWVLWEGLDDLPLPVADDRTLADELGFGDLKMMGEPLDPADGPDAPKVIGTDAAGRPVLDFRNSVVSHFTDQESADNINEFGYRVVGDGYYGEAISFTPNREFGAQFGGVETTARISPDARILQLGVDSDWKMFKAITDQRNVVMMNPRPGQKSWRQAFVEKGIDGVYDAGAGDLFIYNERVVRPTAMDGLGDIRAQSDAADQGGKASKFKYVMLDNKDQVTGPAFNTLEEAQAYAATQPFTKFDHKSISSVEDLGDKYALRESWMLAGKDHPHYRKDSPDEWRRVGTGGNRKRRKPEDHFGPSEADDIKAQSDVDEPGVVMDEDGNLASGLEYPIADRSEWYGDANYKNTGGRIVQMTPDEFLSQVRPLEIDDYSRENIDILKAHIQSGKTLDPLQISSKGKEDGRHRAYAAKELGITSVPVIVWNKGDDAIDIIDKFQSDLDEQPDLVAAHNLTAANLLHADRMGGIAAPSLAIAKASDGHEGYGEITLIGSKDLVDPQKGANVYAGDIYSARYPTVHYNIKYDNIRKLEKQFAATAKDLGVAVKETLDDDALEREGPRALENSVGALLSYAKEKGVKVDGYVFDYAAWEVRNREAQTKEQAIHREWRERSEAERERAQAEGRAPDDTALDEEMQPKYMAARREAGGILREPDRALDEIKYKLRDKFRNDSGFAEWADAKFAELKAKERIFKGFSNTTGAKMYTAHTLDNVVKLMTKKIRDAEGFNYGIGNLRAKVAPKFRSVEAIRGRKGSLVKREEFDAIKKEADAELISIADQLLPKLKYKGNSFGQLDALTQHMAEAVDRNNVKRVLQEYYNGITDDDVRMVGNFLQKLKTMPTTYFEAKLDRAVQIGEFEAAIVPNTLSKKAREVLERSGVKQIIEYDPAVDGARQAAIDSIRDMKFQSDLMRDLGFFSAMEKSIKDADLKSGTGAQWLGYLKNRPGVKAEEMDNSGIADFLTENANEKLTKEQVLQHAKDGAVELEEVTLGAFLNDPENVKPDAEAVAKYQDQWRALAVRRNAAYRKQREAETALDRVAAHKYELEVQDLDDEMNGLSETMVQETIERARGKHNVSGQSKYDEYTLPGGKDYREVLLTLPGTSGAFKSTHFSQHNIVAHARISDRVTKGGKKALHVEEIQSDWHQTGRDKGYGLSDAERKALETRRQQLEDEGQKARKAGQEFTPKLKAEWAEIMNRLQRDKNAVPQAPFKKTWHELMLKRLIRMAVEKGYDEIVITRGQDIAERFDISNQINTLTYRKDNGLYEIAWEGPNGTSGVASHGALESELPGIVGKELAAKIVAGEGKSRGSGAARVTDLSGLDLKIGGEGMKGFYDKIVVDFLNKYGKKYGAKVGTDMIGVGITENSNKPFTIIRTDRGFDVAHDGMRYEDFDTEAQAQAFIASKRDDVKAVHSFPITDAMRTEVMKGQMLFQRDVVDVNAKDQFSAGNYTYINMDTERRQRSAALRDAIEDLIDKYTGGRAKKKWYSSIRQKAGGKIHKVDGGFSELHGLIIMALDAADHVGSVKHEALHFLKAKGLISDVEWDTLVRTALREGWMDKKYGGSKLTVRQRYAHLPNMLDILEEAIAEQFRAGRYDNFQGFPPAVRAILNKLRKFFDGVAKEARKIFGQEATAEDIFRAIESGEIGRRADVEKAKVETAAIMDAPQRSAPQRMKNQSTPEEDPLRVDRWAADDIAIAAEATDDSKRKDETLQDIEADSAILGAHLESMRQRGLLSQEDEADLLASNDTARVMEEQAAAYEAAGICEGEE
jgi:hypothetical protein